MFVSFIKVGYLHEFGRLQMVVKDSTRFVYVVLCKICIVY